MKIHVRASLSELAASLVVPPGVGLFRTSGFAVLEAVCSPDFQEARWKIALFMCRVQYAQFREIVRVRARRREHS